MENATLMGNDCCPHCGTIVNAVSYIGKDEEEASAPKPKPKDLTICLYCSAILYYEDDMSVHDFPKVLFDNLDENIQNSIINTQAAIEKTAMTHPEFMAKRKKNKQLYGYGHDS